MSVANGTCSRCGAGSRGIPARVVRFGLVADGHAGDAEALCQACIMGVGEESDLCVDIPMQELAPGPAGRKKGLRKAKKTSQKQELDIMQELGGHVQPGSGNQRGAKGDGRKKGELRVEAKFTTAESFSLKLEELYKIASECAPGEKPLFVIDFLESGTRKPKDRFAVVDFKDLKELLHAAGQHR